MKVYEAYEDVFEIVFYQIRATKWEDTPPRHSRLIKLSPFIWLLGAAASCLGAKDGADTISLCYEFA